MILRKYLHCFTSTSNIKSILGISTHYHLGSTVYGRQFKKCLGIEFGRILKVNVYRYAQFFRTGHVSNPLSRGVLCGVARCRGGACVHQEYAARRRRRQECDRYIRCFAVQSVPFTRARD